jgi:hypothetical protein
MYLFMNICLYVYDIIVSGGAGGVRKPLAQGAADAGGGHAPAASGVYDIM